MKAPDSEDCEILTISLRPKFQPNDSFSVDVVVVSVTGRQGKHFSAHSVFFVDFFANLASSKNAKWAPKSFLPIHVIKVGVFTTAQR